MMSFKKKTLDPENAFLWIALSVFIKGLFFVFLLSRENVNEIPGFWGSTSGDTSGYILPIENFINTGNYHPDQRMPGYGIFYLPLLILFKKTIALNIQIVIQYLLASLSVYYLAIASYRLFDSRKIFYLVYFLFLISTYSNNLDHFLLSDSLTASFLVFGVFFLVSALDSRKKAHFFLSGLFMAEAVFLRPVFFPVLLFFSILAFAIRYSGFRNSIISALVFLSSFIIADLFWLIHNVSRHDKYFFLQGSMQTNRELDRNYYKPLFRFIQSYGGDFIYWKKNSDIRWFGVDESHNLFESYPPEMNEIKLPGYIYTSRFNEDSLLEIRSRISEIKRNRSIPWDSARRANEIFIRERLDTYRESIKSEKPFLYHVKSRFFLSKRFFINTRANNPFSQRDNLLITVLNQFYSFLYLAVLIFGFSGCMILCLHAFRKPQLLLFPAIPIYTFVIHPLVLRLIENRYLLPAYPFLIVCAAFSIVFIFGKIKPLSGNR